MKIESHSPSEKLILSLAEAAALLGLTPAALYSFTRARARSRHRIPIPFLRLGGRKLAFRKDSLERWISQLEGSQQ